ncbi:CDP-alcohol phosphatidyltransferase family protein [Permianibacter sp. IMCC34836]|uniref:CDP-alcohol phosphatidyltransferase family protein n=1 Tax=Permianibacter fluminis TaxID=2738515 RepID=UPI0015561BD5|nr:CDP-alcohol phosphatidyltransferase family protein [Permianibacter fluminis]NQD37523.1 CDP-alcohol phosphatidyltransferase family protein [Permianibacter fluminis]
MTALRHLPNALTVLRCLLTLPLAVQLAERHYASALGVFVIAGVTDALDGFLAKQFHWQSRFGAIADPLADKLLLLIGFGMLGYIGVLPWWLFWLVLGRDVIIVGGGLTYHLLFGPYPMQPTLLSKANTLLQILLLTLVLLNLGWSPLPAWLLQGGLALISLTTLVSGMDYVWTWGRRCAEQNRLRRRAAK